MSVADKITQLINDISSSYQKIESKGGTIPTSKNTTNLPNAIDSIPSGSGEAVIAPIEITVNGTYTRRALETMLLNDMTTFADSIPADGSAEAVLVIEVGEDEAVNLSAISLNLKNDSKTYTIQLF